MDFVGNLLLTSFPNLTKAQVAVFVAGLLNSDMDLNTFKLHLRDFLVTLKVCIKSICNKVSLRLQHMYMSTIVSLVGLSV